MLAIAFERHGLFACLEMPDAPMTASLMCRYPIETAVNRSDPANRTYEGMSPVRKIAAASGVKLWKWDDWFRARCVARRRRLCLRGLREISGQNQDCQESCVRGHNVADGGR